MELKNRLFFGPSTARRMCQRAAVLYEAEGGDRHSLEARLSVNLTKFTEKLSMIHLDDGALWRRGQVSRNPSLLSRVVGLFFWYRVLRLLIIMTFQYTHDLCLVKMRFSGLVDQSLTAKQVDELASTTVDDGSAIACWLGIFVWARRWLELLGSAFRDFTLVNSMLYTLQLWFMLTTYLAPYLIHVYMNPIEFQSYNMLVDSKGERARYTSITMQILNNMAASDLVRLGEKKLQTGSRLQLQSSRAHECNLRRFRDLALSGQLEPLNRNAAHMQSVVRSRAVLAGLLTVYLMVCLPLFLFGFLWINDEYEERVYSQPADLLDTLESYLICLLSAICALGHLTSAFCSLLDNMHLVRQLERLVNDCVFETRAQITRMDPRLVSRHLNRQLARILVQYKMAVNSLTDQRRTMSILCIIFSQTMVFAPLLALVLAPFYDSHFRSEFLWFISSLFIVVDVGLVQVCQLHKRACRLYKTMSGLAALLAELEDLPAYNRCHCDPTLTRTLRIELSDSSFFVERLSVSMLGNVVDYRYFLRIHLWGGLLLSCAMVLANRMGSSLVRQKSSYMVRLGFF